jgi:hypothetical protein
MITKEGHSYLMDLVLGKEEYADFKLKLFTAPTTPDIDSEYADFTWEDDDTAGPAITLASASWSHSWTSSKEDADYAEQTFTYTDAASSPVYGSAIVDNAEGIVIAFKLGTGGDWPASPDADEAIKVTPDLKSSNPA